ncbi:MAG TPA: hypothetical protein VGN52_04560 [Burkholderiales bacterium]|jgi:hypothetical protein
MRKTSRQAADFRWAIGAGPDEWALARMRKAFPRPREPMGEAWFMGKQRRMFTELIENDITGLRPAALIDPLREIASGTGSFGRMREWRDWFNHLLPHLVPMAGPPNGGEIRELLISGFFTQYPADMPYLPYREFRADALATLGCTIMGAGDWSGNPPMLKRMVGDDGRFANEAWPWRGTGGDISACLFFCLRYLPVSTIGDWAASALTIDDPHWRAQLMIWLVGARRILGNPKAQPADLSDQYPSIEWSLADCLKGNYSGSFAEPVVPEPFIPIANRSAFDRAVAAFFTPQLRQGWIDSIDAVDYLANGAAPAMSALEAMLDGLQIAQT